MIGCLCCVREDRPRGTSPARALRAYCSFRVTTFCGHACSYAGAAETTASQFHGSGGGCCAALGRQRWRAPADDEQPAPERRTASWSADENLVAYASAVRPRLSLALGIAPAPSSRSHTSSSSCPLIAASVIPRGLAVELGEAPRSRNRLTVRAERAHVGRDVQWRAARAEHQQLVTNSCSFLTGRSLAYSSATRIMEPIIPLALEECASTASPASSAMANEGVRQAGHAADCSRAHTQTRTCACNIWSSTEAAEHTQRHSR